MILARRNFIKAAGSIVSTALWSDFSPVYAQDSALSFLTAGPGSGFLPYGEGVASVVNAQGVIKLNVVQTKGSIDNLKAVESSPTSIGTVFIGSAYEAIGGIGPFAGVKHTNLRALAPMYETSFQIAARAESGITRVSQLAGRKVGVGPATGPAEAFFKGLVEVTGVAAIIVTGTSAELEAAYLKGEIDAFWQGASVPVPALVRVTDASNSGVFGLTDSEVDAMLKRFPYLAPGDIPASTYKGQPTALRSVAAWNVIVAHANLLDETAYLLTKAILTADGITVATKGAGASTKAINAVKNKVVPWHPGALRFFKESGVIL
jgi:uncharacterized protein